MVSCRRRARARILAVKFSIDGRAVHVDADRRDKASARRFLFELPPIAHKGGYTPDSIATTASQLDVGGYMNWKHSKLGSMIVGCIAALMLAGCAASGGSGSTNTWTTADLTAALNSPTRAQADRDRDADRKPAELMNFFGVARGMTALDLIASGGYTTEVLAVAVGPTGKVYSQNPPAFLKFNSGAYDKALSTRLAGNRLANVVRVDADLPAAGTVPPGSVDVAITALNLHDIYNRDAAAAGKFLQDVFSMLKPGGVLGVIDHVGVAGGDNMKLHRMQKSDAIAAAKGAGFTVEAESNLLAHAGDDHTKGPFDPALRGKTDQCIGKLRNPK
jgi:predicted methyltransferase